MELFIIVAILVIAVVIAILRAALRINKSVEQRGEIIKLLKVISLQNQEARSRATK